MRTVMLSVSLIPRSRRVGILAWPGDEASQVQVYEDQEISHRDSDNGIKVEVMSTLSSI